MQNITWDSATWPDKHRDSDSQSQRASWEFWNGWWKREVLALKPTAAVGATQFIPLSIFRKFSQVLGPVKTLKSPCLNGLNLIWETLSGSEPFKGWTRGVAIGVQPTSLFWVGATSGPFSRCCECELLIATDPLSPECGLAQDSYLDSNWLTWGTQGWSLQSKTNYVGQSNSRDPLRARLKLVSSWTTSFPCFSPCTIIIPPFTLSWERSPINHLYKIPLQSFAPEEPNLKKTAYKKHFIYTLTPKKYTTQLRNGQRTRIDISPEIYRWPISKWEDVQHH